MISNKRQYSNTQKQLEKFNSVLDDLKNNVETAQDLNQQIRHQVHLDAVNSQIESLEEEISEYEQLKSGEVQKLYFDSFSQLSEALIKARIVRGLTQEQLANRLGLKTQQVQRYESTNYVAASLERISKVIEALNIEIKEEIIFK